MAAAERHSGEEAKRLVKVWLPADLVRQIDSAILASRGAYIDRTEFMTEGARGLLDELRHELPAAPPVDDDAPPPGEHGSANGSAPPPTRFGDWVDAGVATLPSTRGPETNFGLHNRDLPTLWALDELGRIVARNGGPIGWEQLNAALLPVAWEEARRLRARSLDRGDGIKAEAGFPTQVKKREAVERRFLTHFAGTSQNRGPWFVFRLVGVEDETVAPTPAAVELIRALSAEDIGAAPPFTPGAWEIFREYLSREAPEELRVWMRVLEIVFERPTRAELVSRCGWWSGSQAETNSSSFVVRGREWGLVDPALHEGRYRLTDLGGQAIQAASEIG